MPTALSGEEKPDSDWSIKDSDWSIIFVAAEKKFLCRLAQFLDERPSVRIAIEGRGRPGLAAFFSFLYTYT